MPVRPSLLRRIAAAAAGTMIAGLAPAVAADAHGEAAATINWQACTEDHLDGAECATITVPLDHDRPRGARIRIAISRIAATAPAAERLGPLVLNLGGPGVPWREAVFDLAAQLPEQVAARYDLIGLDPRGVGASQPRLRCDPRYFRPPLPDLAAPPVGPIRAAERDQRAAVADYVQACADHVGPAYLQYLRTVDVARDLDLLRTALGADRLSLIGQSYGSYLGQVYASHFPARTGRMVLSGMVAPQGVGTAGDLGRPVVARAHQRVIEAFFAWVAHFHPVYGLGSDAASVQARFHRDEEALRLQPVGPIGPHEWRVLFAAAVYDEADWPVLAQLWSDWVRGDQALLLTLFSAIDLEEQDRSNASYFANACSDGRWERKYPTLRRTTRATAKAAPFVAWVHHWLVAVPCGLWPTARDAVEVDGAGAPPLLFVNATAEAVTLFTDALDARAVFPRSVLVAEDGLRSHANSVFDPGSTPCVNDLAHHYLLTGRLPTRQPGRGADVICARRPAQGMTDVVEVAAAVRLRPALDLLEELVIRRRP